MTARLIMALAVASGLSCSIAQDSRVPTTFIVVDGDTIRNPAGVRYRLMGFDSPEIFHAQCDGELALAMRAKHRMEQLIASSEARLVESGKRDKYGRALVILKIQDRDVAETMIGEGPARPYYGRRRRSWCD